MSSTVTREGCNKTTALTSSCFASSTATFAVINTNTEEFCYRLNSLLRWEEEAKPKLTTPTKPYCSNCSHAFVLQGINNWLRLLKSLILQFHGLIWTMIKHWLDSSFAIIKKKPTMHSNDPEKVWKENQNTTQPREQNSFIRKMKLTCVWSLIQIGSGRSSFAGL